MSRCRLAITAIVTWWSQITLQVNVLHKQFAEKLSKIGFINSTLEEDNKKM